MYKIRPDFSRLKKVLLRDGEPDRVPFFDLYPSASFMETVVGKPAGSDTTVEFFYKMGYDYVYSEAGFNYNKLVNTTDSMTFVENNHGVIENRKDFDAFPWRAVDSSVVTGISIIEKLLPSGMKLNIDFSCGGVLEVVMALMGYMPLSYALYEDEQLIWDIFEKIGTDHINILKECFRNIDHASIGVITMGEDMGFSHSTMLSPEHFRKFLFPWHKKIVELVHNYDIPFVLHSCGKLDSIMDDLIDYVGIDAKHSYEDKILPVTEAKKKYGDRIAILGGVDIDFLCNACETGIREYVGNILNICAPGGGYALGTGNSIAGYIPVANYMIMLDEGRKQGGYVKKL